MKFYLSFLYLIIMILACNEENQNHTPTNPLTSLEIGVKGKELLKDHQVVLPNSSALQALQEVFWDKYLLAWNITSSELESYLSHSSIPGKDLDYAQTNFAGPDNEWFSENKQVYPNKIKQQIADNVKLEGFPNFFHRGITINHTSVRRVPSHKPGYDTYSKAGEGFPFDYFQESGIWANTPVLLLHISEDRQWVYTLTAFYKGWVPFKDLALVNDEFIEKWTSGEYVFITRDHVPIHSENGIHGMEGRIGMIFPASKGNIFIPIANESRQAKLIEANVSKDHIAEGFSEMNEELLKNMANDMLGQAYGWGGYLENRDCSATIRDYLAPFGVWLPRNSTDQATYGDSIDGSYYDLSGIKSRDEKLSLIKEEGVPFLTILWKKGHSMLYIGENNEGMPLVMHTIWGLKTLYNDVNMLENISSSYPVEGIHKVSIEDKASGQKSDKFMGRRLIGKTVITPINFDQVYPDLQSFLVDDLVKMSVLINQH